MAATQNVPVPYVQPIINSNATVTVNGNSYPVNFQNTAQITPPWMTFFQAIFKNLQSLDTAITPDNGDNSITLVPIASPTNEVWNTALTANRTISFTTSQNLYNGATFTIIRTAAATGAFNLTVAAGSGNVILPPGYTSTVTYNGSSWIATAATPLNPNQLANGTYISSNGIYTGTITCSQLLAGNLAANIGYLGTVYANQINASDLSAISANLGTVTAGSIYSGFFSTGLSSNNTLPFITLSNATGLLDAYSANGDLFLEIGVKPQGFPLNGYNGYLSMIDSGNNKIADLGTFSSLPYRFGIQTDGNIYCQNGFISPSGYTISNYKANGALSGASWFLYTDLSNNSAFAASNVTNNFIFYKSDQSTVIANIGAGGTQLNIGGTLYTLSVVAGIVHAT